MLHLHMHSLLQRAQGALATVDAKDRGRRDGEGILAAATTIAAIRNTVGGHLSGINGPMIGSLPICYAIHCAQRPDPRASAMPFSKALMESAETPSALEVAVDARAAKELAFCWNGREAWRGEATAP